MRIGTIDVTNIRSGTGPFVAEALAHLDGLFDYLHTPNEPAADPPGTQASTTGAAAEGTNAANLSDANTPVSGDHVRTDFSDVFMHTETASRAGRMLQIFAALAANAMWLRVTEAAIKEHGDQATTAHVLHRMSGILASRVVRQHVGRDPIAMLYSSMINDEMAGICTMLKTIVDTAPYMTEIYSAVAPKLGCTTDELELRLKSGDVMAGRAVAEECVTWTERKWREHGGQLDESTRATFRAMAGLNPGGTFAAGGADGPISLGDALTAFGLDPANATEIAPGVHVLGLSGAGAAFTPPPQGSVLEGDHIRVG